VGSADGGAAVRGVQDGFRREVLANAGRQVVLISRGGDDTCEGIQSHTSGWKALGSYRGGECQRKFLSIVFFRPDDGSQNVFPAKASIRSDIIL
jgi:hypothetical protein